MSIFYDIYDILFFFECTCTFLHDFPAAMAFLLATMYNVIIVQGIADRMRRPDV